MATTRILQIDFHLEEFIDTTVPLISSSYKQSIPILAKKNFNGMDILSCFYEVQKQIFLKSSCKKIYNLFKLSAVYIPEQT